MRVEISYKIQHKILKWKWTWSWNFLKFLILLTCMIMLFTKSGRNRTREMPKAMNVTPKRWYLQHHDALHCLFLLPSIWMIFLWMIWHERSVYWWAKVAMMMSYITSRCMKCAQVFIQNILVASCYQKLYFDCRRLLSGISFAVF